MLPGSVVRRYERFSLYNSPYPAHDSGCAIDLYPGSSEAESPVSGEVLETRTVRCPPKHYAVDEDHLILLDCGEYVARILHVNPSVEAGEAVAVGDSLGTLVRSGFFGQWVDNHIHLGFRRHDQNLRRARGSLPVEVDVAVAGVPWDGTGDVVETGPTHVVLDSPDIGAGAEEGIEEGFLALASDDGTPLDGGLAHYAGGGVLAPADGEISLLGSVVGVADGRDVAWTDIALYANGRLATGLSLFASRGPFGTKVVFHEGHEFSVGDHIEMTIEPTDDPVRLG